MKRLLKNKNIITIIISCIIIVILLASSSFFRVLNKTIQNKYYAIKNEIIGLEANPHILIVELDDASIKEFGSYPFSRWIYAQILNNLQEYQTAVVAFDILFLDPSNNQEDALFSKAIAQYPNIVLWSSIDSSGNIQTPFSGIKKWSYTSGFLSPNIERSNNTVYSFTPILKWKQRDSYEHFTLQILRAFYRYLYDDPKLSQLGSLSEREYIFSENISYPLATKNSQDILINFIPSHKFLRVSLKDLYDANTLRQLDKNIHLKDKIILIWPAADGLKDDFFTPNGIEYGVNIHANILNTLLSWAHMMYFDRYLEWLMIFFIIILSVFANLSSSSKVLFFSNIAIVGVFWFIIPLSVLLWTSLILNYPSEIIFSLILAFTSANIVKYLIEDKNKQKLNKALSEYVWVNIADEILLEQGKVNLDGQEKNLVCFFSDIEGFTSLSEILTPWELVTFLREYLSEMTSIIMEEKGHIDKFEWDAIMALWWAFTQQSKSDFVRACQSALLQQEALQKINKKWKQKFGKNLRVRMWIHGGTAIIGNIWAIGKKMEFTALGDNINIASRLEWVNKYYGTFICVSEVVYLSVKDFFAFRYLDDIQVKGKDKSLKIYELLGKQEDIWEEKKQIFNAFSGAVSLYKEKNFVDAKDIFERLSEEGDTPSRTYIDRCEYYIQNPPSDSWNGVWRMEEK